MRVVRIYVGILHVSRRDLEVKWPLLCMLLPNNKLLVEACTKQLEEPACLQFAHRKIRSLAASCLAVLDL